MDKIQYKFLWVLFWVIFVSSCTDEEIVKQLGAEGKEVILSEFIITTSGNEEKDIPLTRADSPSDVISVTIFIFDAIGNNYEGNLRYTMSQNQISDITDIYVSKKEGDRVYRLKGGNLKVTTGRKIIYAIANENDGYWSNGSSVIAELESATTLNEFKQKLMEITSSLNNTLPYITGTQILLTGIGTDVNVKADSNDPTKGKATGTIHMKRPVARIVFRINTVASTFEGNEATFIPTGYTVYNIPTKSLVFNNEGLVPPFREEDKVRYINTTEIQIGAPETGGTAYFAFYCPENTQNVNNDITEYHQRDLSEKDIDGKNVGWANAPSYSTYVKITGDYTEIKKSGSSTSETEELVYQGSTSYTIHLGDFSDTGSMGNFSVERNTRYIYTVSVKGVNNIITEATTDKEGQPGAEGDIIGNEIASQIYDLDCHYEQVIVSYNLTDIANEVGDNTDLIGALFRLRTSTPFSTSSEKFIEPYTLDKEGKTEDEATVGMDYKWVEFYSQNNSTQIAAYPGKGSPTLFTPYELCVKLGKIVAAMKSIGNKDYGTVAKEEGITLTTTDNSIIAHFTAFIDEYYYDRNPLVPDERVNWATFTRQPDRTMLIASSIYVSPDGNSSYSRARSSFTQRSIQTFYNSQAANEVNAMGVETYCENELFSYNSYSWNTFDNDFTMINDNSATTNGRNNMIRLSNINDETYWEWLINTAGNGYLTPEDSRKHKLNNSAMLNGQYRHLYYACLSRNRDLDGNHKIDDNEIRWYLAASDQYLRIGIGSDAMSDASRLYQGDKSAIPDGTYPIDFLGNGALYHTSTHNLNSGGHVRQVIWAAEVGAFGSAGNLSSNNPQKYYIRCVRNLPSLEVAQSSPAIVVGDDALGESSYNPDKVSKYIFDFDNRLDPLIYRPAPQNGPYQPHYEEPNETNDSEANRLYSGGFVVAEKNVQENRQQNKNFTFNDMVKIWNGELDPCANYYDQNAPAYRGRWRVPNLREMLIMSTQIETLNLTGWCYYATSTRFSGAKIDETPSIGDRYGFVFNAMSGFITAEPSGNTAGGSDIFYVRCVRDAAPNEVAN